MSMANLGYMAPFPLSTSQRTRTGMRMINPTIATTITITITFASLKT